jgi:outer membrane immunogenic protein
MMQKYGGYLLATASGLATAMSGAQAADLPMKAAPRVAPPPPPLWTGFYIGGHIGGAWQNVNPVYLPGGGYGFGASGWGFLGGGQIGYNWQTGNIVWGVEADISGVGDGASSPGPTGKGSAIKTELDWLATFRLRLGIASGPLLGYVTGGAAVADVNARFSPNGFGASCDQAFCSKSASKTQWGWTAGLGAEYMVAPRWTVGVEALYVDLGSIDGRNSDASKTSRFNNLEAFIGRFKVNFKF